MFGALIGYLTLIELAYDKKFTITLRHGILVQILKNIKTVKDIINEISKNIQINKILLRIIKTFMKQLL